MNTPLGWAEIDLTAIAHNIGELRRCIGDGPRFMAVVKADAYGHGAERVARQALSAGAQWLGVARIDEGIALRRAGLDAPILIFGYTPPARAIDLLANDLTATVFAGPVAEAYARTAVSEGKTLKVHLKVDTGMGRLGLVAGLEQISLTGKAVTGNALREVETIAGLKGLALEGIFTHFAAADSTDKTYAHAQLERYMDFLDNLGRIGIEIPLRHTANSAAIIDFPQSHLDMVRAGIAMYGLPPSDETNLSQVTLKPAMALKARIIHLKQVPAAFPVSYGMTWHSTRPTTIATVPIGYADGFSRLLSNRGEMLVCGRRAPIAGRVCMDLTMLDVGHIPQASVEDEVVLIGHQGEDALTAEDLARHAGTINYEVVSAIAARVPRIYIS
ncbi:MAG: alanine racemase [Desulfobacterales bacterium]|nr:alanine racemase [Desulfobacterales bacterium]